MGAQSLGPDQTLNGGAKLLDVNGNKIDGVTFSWQVLGPGNGVLAFSRDGTTVSLTNHYYVRHHKKVYLTGQVCYLQAQAIFMGRVVSGVSGPITL